MTVKAILSGKSHDVITIEPTARIETAVGILAEHRIGAVIVTDQDRHILGILSERDVVRALAERGPAMLTEPVAQVMTRKVVTCSESETVSGIMERMTGGKFRHVPVVDRGRLVGVVSIGDVVKYRLSEIERESSALREYILTA
ncbi:MAG TPA: CBS domain-containing protein [Xanthobacteraceae bacterium]|nr:CBS domain-containing protein [Xanthobacteraceae bacterium]